MTGGRVPELIHEYSTQRMGCIILLFDMENA